MDRWTDDVCLPALPALPALPGLAGPAGDAVGLLAAACEEVRAARAVAGAASDVAWESSAAQVFREAMREAQGALMWDQHRVEEAVGLTGAYLLTLDDARRSAAARIAGGVL